MQHFTQEDLVQFMYHETDDKKSALIMAALEENWDLKEKYQVLLSAHRQLESVMLKPEEKTMNKIMAHIEKSVTEEIVSSA